MILAGVDGCSAGWLLVGHNGQAYTYGVYPNINDLLADHPNLDRILIDIPIGLSSEGYPRTIDRHLRKALKGRASTVFNAPCRAAVYESDDQKARAYNQKIEGKSLSIQSLNIRDKIRQLDVCLAQKETQVAILESHPEFCFKNLRGGGVLQSKKSTAEGITERLEILSSFDASLVHLYQQILSETKRKDLKKDDILDAICLCVVNRLAGKEHLQFLQDTNRFDERGIEMKVAYYQIP